jgi:type IV pilus modification protein PilV
MKTTISCPRAATVAPARRGRRSRSEGFSLLETMIAMVVLGIGLLGVAQMIPLALAGVTQAGLRTSAVQAAQQRLDNLRSSEFADAALQAGTYTETLNGYSLAWTITDDDPVEGSKRIALTASWETVHGTRTTDLSTFITRGSN